MDRATFLRGGAAFLASVISFASIAGGAGPSARTPWSKPTKVTLAATDEPAVVYVKFVDDAPIRLVAGAPADVNDPGAGALRGAKAVIDTLPIARWERVHAASDARLTAMRDTATRTRGAPTADMTVEFFAFVADPARTASVIDALNALDAVEVALPLPKPPPPPLPPNFEPNQGHLLASPAGVDAVHAWSVEHTRGAGVAIADLEYTFNVDHADLPEVTLLGGTPVDPGFGPNHGTAVLGELAALDNGWGTTGIASDAAIHFARTYNGSSWNVAGAITAAMNALEPGDIILIEQQMGGPNGQYVPVEWFPPWYNAIATAVGNGFVVVMAAGNGGQNLDDPMFSQGNGGHWPFLPQNDSGAIIVGAGAAAAGFGNSTTPHSRLSFSTYGSRVNLQGWGQGVWTTGYGGAYAVEGENLHYTSSFSGTSSASPIVAGACALVQAAHKERFSGDTLTSQEMRALLESTGFPQQSGEFPASQRIGPLPDVAAAIASLAGPCLGDANGDGVVNFADLNAALGEFGRRGAGLTSDFDADGDVDFADLNTVLARFGASCP